MKTRLCRRIILCYSSIQCQKHKIKSCPFISKPPLNLSYLISIIYLKTNECATKNMTPERWRARAHHLWCRTLTLCRLTSEPWSLCANNKPFTQPQETGASHLLLFLFNAYFLKVKFLTCHFIILYCIIFMILAVKISGMF